jgi:agmatine/peptidylarginine deiminase
MPADFERQSAILVGVNELLPHHPHVLTGLVSALIDRIPVVAVITGEGQRRELLATLCDWGLPAHRVRALRSPAVGLWVRDYGPSFIKRDGRVIVLDAEYAYLQPRPDDDQFPAEVARLMDLEVRHVPLAIEGGNILSNGRGLAITTQVVTTRNAHRYKPAEALTQLVRFYGFRQIACTPPLLKGPTAHVDMFATFTAPDTVVVGRYDPADDPVNADMLDRMADYLRGMDSGAGPLKVERIPMPPHGDGVWRTYANAVYANDVVVVPVYAGVDPRVEREALDTYRRLLPGREILTVEATSLARTGGALRCVTLNVPHLGQATGFEDASDVGVAVEGVRGSFGGPALAEAWHGPRGQLVPMEM